MYEVDTISFVVNFRQYIFAENGNKVLDFKRLAIAENKIKPKLYYDTENQKKIESGKNDVGMKANSNGYYFYYNCNWKSLTITVPHYRIEKHTANEIVSNIKEILMDYFQLTENETR